MEQKVTVVIDTDGEYCGECRFRYYNNTGYRPGPIMCALYGGFEEDNYPPKRIPNCLRATGELK